MTIQITNIVLYFQDIPPPGTYDVQKSYDHSQVHIERAKPRTEVASRKHGSFLSAASRFAPPRDVVGSKADLDNPGKPLKIDCFLFGLLYWRRRFGILMYQCILKAQVSLCV